MDTNPEKLAIFGTLSQQVCRLSGCSVEVSTTSDARTALQGARYVITTIRVGEDAGRILDERIALRHGVLGQETTGPGGFAMALRSIPAILSYARLLEEVSHGAWILNFTNPAGLVTQALRDQGYARSVGICDSANLAQNSVATWLGIDPPTLRAEVFGLNHLSWARAVMRDGDDLLAPLLNDPRFQEGTLLHLFDPHLISKIGMYLNEYLFYYYYRDEALRQIQSKPHTRGEEVAEWNSKLFQELRDLDYASNPLLALETYGAYCEQRSSTYMPYSYSDRPATLGGHIRLRDAEQEEEGYAGVALEIIRALETGQPLYTATNVPCEGAISGMDAGDVVEVSCRVDRTGIHPLPIGDIPIPQLLLMKSVKLYECITARAVVAQSRDDAAFGLMNHPLVQSYSLAKTLVDEYISAHQTQVGNWRA